MKKTDYNLDDLATMISSESSFSALVQMMDEMGLAFDGARAAQ